MTAEIKTELKEGERVVSTFDPYYATSDRVLLYAETKKGFLKRELSYPDLESIEMVKSSNRRLMALGTVVTAAGLALAILWGFHLPLMIVALGLYTFFIGAMGRPAYYQIQGKEIPRRELPLWQIHYHGAGSFVATIRTIMGEDSRTEGNLHHS